MFFHELEQEFLVYLLEALQGDVVTLVVLLPLNRDKVVNLLVLLH